MRLPLLDLNLLSSDTPSKSLSTLDKLPKCAKANVLPHYLCMWAAGWWSLAFISNKNHALSSSWNNAPLCLLGPDSFFSVRIPPVSEGQGHLSDSYQGGEDPATTSICVPRCCILYKRKNSRYVIESQLIEQPREESDWLIDGVYLKCPDNYVWVVVLCWIILYKAAICNSPTCFPFWCRRCCHCLYLLEVHRCVSRIWTCGFTQDIT